MNMAKIGLHQITQSVVMDNKNAVAPKFANPVEKQKSARLSRRRRLNSRKSTARQSASQPEIKSAPDRAKAVTHRSHEGLDDGQPAESGKPDHPTTDPFVKLHADVQKLKKALEAEDKAKRTTKIQHSKLQTPKGQVDASATQKDSKNDHPKQSVRKYSATDAKSAPNTSDTAPLRAKSSAAGLAGAVIKGMSSLKDGLVRNVASSKSERKIPKKLDSKPLKLPRRTGSKKDAVIEVVNAETLSISGIVICLRNWTKD